MLIYHVILLISLSSHFSFAYVSIMKKYQSKRFLCDIKLQLSSWEYQWDLIKSTRDKLPSAPVDTMGAVIYYT